MSTKPYNFPTTPLDIFPTEPPRQYLLPKIPRFPIPNLQSRPPITSLCNALERDISDLLKEEARHQNYIDSIREIRSHLYEMHIENCKGTEQERANEKKKAEKIRAIKEQLQICQEKLAKTLFARAQEELRAEEELKQFVSKRQRV